MLNKLLILFISVLIHSSFAKVENSFCIKEDASFHSQKNKVRLITSTNELWIAQSFQSDKLSKGCYSLDKVQTSYNILKDHKSVITSQLYKLIDSDNAAVYLIEKRTL